MKAVTPQQIIADMQSSERITFLTGAGVSTPSGIPDYRSLDGIYPNIERPEYLLSHTALEKEPAKFYAFVKRLYHPQAQPNVIHQAMAALEKQKPVWVISQNIDGLHRNAGSQHLVEFHGNLYDCYCRKCGQTVSWEDYLQTDIHEDCSGQLRPKITLYEEGLDVDRIEKAVKAVQSADLIVIVGTTLQVYPFRDLIQYRASRSRIIAVNQTLIDHPSISGFYQGDAVAVFEEMSKK